MAREHSFVLPSGVLMKVRALNGGDQGTITKQDTIGKIDTFNQMLADCTLQLGSKTTVTKNDIERMLVNDRKYALVELRQFSLRYKEEFNFNYEWPITGGKKENQAYSVVFSRESFDIIPFSWTRKFIESLSEEELKELEKSKKHYPEIYNDYEDMLRANLEQTFITEEGLQIRWKLLDCLQETKFQDVSSSLKDVNLPILMRDPKVVLKSATDSKETLTSWDIRRADIIDIEAFRTEMRNVEGFIDTFLTIQNQTNASKNARVDLLGTVDFFFPSQAI